MKANITNLIKALEIFKTYGDIDYPIACDWEVMYVLVNPDRVSREDKESLRNLGFEPSLDELNFFSFRYGSA